MDQLAYANAWRAHPAMEKALFALGGLLVCLLARHPAIGFGWALLISCLACVGARIPLRLWLRILGAPTAFLLAAGLGVALEWGVTKGSPFAFSFPTENVQKALLVSSRSMGAFTSLLFLGATTPMTDLIGLLRRLKVFEGFIEILHFGYRGIWILLDSLGQMHRAQASRLGYSTARGTMRSLGLLASQLFLLSLMRAQQDFRALQSRGYQDRLEVLTPTRPPSRIKLLFLGCFFIGILIISCIWTHP